MKKLEYIAAVVFICALFACGKGPYQPVDYVSWVENEENGLRVVKEIGELIFTVQYKPFDYILLKELKSDMINEEERKQKIAEIEDLQYYTFQIGTKGQEQDLLKTKISGMEEYNQRIEYFSFKIQQDIKLVENGDTLPCVLHHFERTYGIAPYINIVLAFERKDGKDQPTINHNKSFVYKDRLFDVGTVKLNIQGSDLDNIPKLKTN